jgi:hypothetical protein
VGDHPGCPESPGGSRFGPGSSTIPVLPVVHIKTYPRFGGGVLECQKLAGEYSILIRHVAALRRRAIDLRHAVAGETTTKRVTGRVHQIARELEAEAVQLERVARTKP